jgi:hypothetical protein
MTTYQNNEIIEPKDSATKIPKKGSPDIGKSLPPILINKKLIDLSPKRTVITLKIPKVELTPRDSQFVGLPKLSPQDKPENNRYLSMSVDCKLPSPEVPKNILKSNIINQRLDYKSSRPYQLQLSLDDSFRLEKNTHKYSTWKIKAAERLKIRKISNMSRKIWKEYIAKPFVDDEFTVKGESKPYKLSKNPSKVNESSIFATIKTFKEHTDVKYKQIYDEIDYNKVGYIILDDIINTVILLSLKNQTDKDQSYLSVKTQALEIFQVFFLVSMKAKITRKDFFAVCSVYEHNNGNNLISEFFNAENFQRLKGQITDLKQIFNCYAKDGFIDARELKSILVCIHTDDVYQIESLLCADPIDFARFLRFLPLFLWMHQEVLKHLEINQ